MNLYHLFEVYGIEAEYMIVDKDTLKILPISDLLIKHFNNNVIINEVELGTIAISNEIVKHVIELKTNGPKKDLLDLYKEFYKIILLLNEILEDYQAILMPTAMHPFMKPQQETYLWEYDNQEIYFTYDKIFNCKGHGWSNLQSVHINLPFFDEDEFVNLHNAIRLILPLIPALSASSPFVEGKFQYLDSRLYFYEKNQEKIPSITGKVIPEWTSSIKNYYEMILYPMYRDIKPYDEENILQEEWLNSRGAIARFERNTIEIRLMDIQECPLMDFSLILLWIKLIGYLIKNNKIINLELELLYWIYKNAIKYGTSLELPQQYLQLWDIKQNTLFIKDFIFEVLNFIDYPEKFFPYLKIILEKGNLSERILKKKNSCSLIEIYKQIIECLKQNQYFL